MPKCLSLIIVLVCLWPSALSDDLEQTDEYEDDEFYTVTVRNA